MTSLLAAGMALLCCCNVLAQRPSLGRCPTHPLMDNFDLDKFTGEWYEVERSFYLLDIAASCTKLNITSGQSGGLEIALKSINKWTGNPSISLGEMLPSADPALLEYKVKTQLPPAVARMLPRAGLYSVLGADYDKFAVLYSCSNMGPLLHADLIWVYGRKPELSVDTRAQVYSLLHQLNIDPDRLTVTKQRECYDF